MQPLDWARGQLGVTESPAGSNCQQYSHDLGRPCEAWCADFVVWCHRRGGVVLPSESAYTPTMANGFKAAGRWHAEPAVGDVAFFDFDGGGIDHVGIVESWTATTVTTIDGNTSVSGSQSSGGQVLRRTRNRSLVTGFGRPGVKPMYDPPIAMQPIVADCGVDGTTWRYLLAQDGGVFTFGGAPFRGSPPGDPRCQGKSYQWARIEADRNGYTTITTTGLRFGYPHA